jgi:hypothetical protein
MVASRQLLLLLKNNIANTRKAKRGELNRLVVEIFFQNFDQNFDISFSSTFFVLSRFRVFLSDGSSNPLQKTFCKTNRVEKFLQTIRPNNPKPIFSRFLFVTFSGVSR